jgi:Spy/CpxP family protein refolding chaperone
MGGELPEGDEHRHSHHAGIVGLIARSVQDLDVSADQKAKLEAVRADLLAKLEPARAAAHDFSGTLADGVAAGKLDRTKVDAATGALVTKAQAAHDASLKALDDLHATLTPEQRAKLVDGLQTHWERWKEAHGRDEQSEPQHRSGYLLALVRDVGLTREQAQKIKDALHDKMKAGPQEHAHKEVADYVSAFGTAFKGDKFDAKKLAGGKGASGHMAKWGAARMTHFVEIALPVLTPEQRTKLAAVLRERAGEQPNP